MTKTITVRRYTRRRTGKTAKIAIALGIDPRVKVEPYKRRRPNMPAYRHSDDGTLCGDAAREQLFPTHRTKCPHNREVKLA